MEELKKLIISFIGKTQNKTADEVSALLFDKNAADNTEVLKPNAIDALYDLEKTRVQGFDAKVKEHYDKGFSAAKATELSKYEKELRDKHQITEELKGTELWDAIATKLTKNTGTGEPTEDQIKRSKVYLDTIDTLKKEKQTVETEWKTKYEGREKQLQKEATFKTIGADALKELKKLNAILPEEETLAQEWENIFLQKLLSYDFEIKEDGKKVVLVKDGENTKVHLDEFGHPVPFEAVVKKIGSSLFKFKQGEDRSGTGNNNDNNDSTKGYKGPVPANETEYMKLIGETKDEAAKIEITKAWNVKKQTLT